MSSSILGALCHPYVFWNPKTKMNRNLTPRYAWDWQKVALLPLIFMATSVIINNRSCEFHKIITSGIKITHGVLALGSNSVLFAWGRFMTCLANSTTAICIPRHIPRYGTLFSRAYLAARIFPWTPLSPKPPGTKMPSALWNERPLDNHGGN